MTSEKKLRLAKKNNKECQGHEQNPPTPAIGNTVLPTPIPAPTTIHQPRRRQLHCRYSSHTTAHPPLSNCATAVHCSHAAAINCDCATTIHLTSPPIVPLSIGVAGVGVDGICTTSTGWRCAQAGDSPGIGYVLAVMQG